MNDIDWVAVLRHITAKNVAKWVAVCAFAIAAIGGSIFFVVVLWNAA